MVLIILIAKSLLVLFFLIMFIRTSKPAWGIGLLTVTSAILLDTFLGTLGRDEMLAELGFFLYVIAGVLISGAALWMWAILQDFVTKPGNGESTGVKSVDEKTKESEDYFIGRENDREVIINEQLQQASHEDLMDLIFDLGWSNNDISSFLDQGENLVSVITNLALERNQMENLRVALSHIREPLPAENLPRTMRLKPDTPPMILRHYILRHLSLDEIDQIAIELLVDLSAHQDVLKRMKARQLLWKLIEQQRLAALIELIKNLHLRESSEI